MYHKPNSTMTAVEIVSARYDGPIPADVMMEARAEDAAYRANQDQPVTSKLAEERMMVDYYKTTVLELIAAKRSMDKSGLKNSAWSFGVVQSNFNAWRSCRRALAAMQAAP